MNPESRFPFDPPPVARPVEPRAFAPEPVQTLAYGVAAAPYAAVPAGPPVYPDISLTRTQSLVDLVVVGCALVLGDFALAGFSQLLIETLEGHGMLLLNTVIGVMTLAFVGLALYVRRQSYETVGFVRPPASVLLVTAVAAVPACYLVSAGAGFLYVAYNMVAGGTGLQEVAEQRQEFFAIIPDPTWSTFLLFAAFTALHEELLFRGFALPRLIRVFNSKWAGVAVCSAIFGLAHAYQGTMSILQTGGLGLVFCLAAILSRSLWPAIIAHALFNGVNLALIPLLRDMLPEMLEQLSTQPAAG